MLNINTTAGIQIRLPFCDSSLQRLYNKSPLPKKLPLSNKFMACHGHDWRQTPILLLYIWSCLYLVLTLISSYPILYCNTSFSSFNGDLSHPSLSDFLFSGEHFTMWPKFPSVKNCLFSLFQVTPIQSNLEQKSFSRLIAKWKNITESKCGICSTIPYYT